MAAVRKRFTTLAIALLALALLCGTAAANGNLATVMVDSTPSGAKVVVRSHTVGVTPTRIQVLPDRAFTITLRKQGFRKEVVDVAPLRPGQTISMAVLLHPRR